MLNGEETGKLDRLLDELGEHRKEVKGHGEILARLDERTENQKDRLDRVEKKSAALGAVTGGLAAAAVAIAKALGIDNA